MSQTGWPRPLLLELVAAMAVARLGDSSHQLDALVIRRELACLADLMSTRRQRTDLSLLSVGPHDPTLRSGQLCCFFAFSTNPTIRPEHI